MHKRQSPHAGVVYIRPQARGAQVLPKMFRAGYVGSKPQLRNGASHHPSTSVCHALWLMSSIDSQITCSAVEHGHHGACPLEDSTGTSAVRVPCASLMSSLVPHWPADLEWGPCRIDCLGFDCSPSCNPRVFLATMSPQTWACQAGTALPRRG